MTANETIEAIDIEKLTAILSEETPRWRVVSDVQWAAAMSRKIERRAYRINVDVPGRRTPVRAWAWVDDEDSRWEGDGHSETWHIGAEEPSQIVGGWGGGQCDDVSPGVVHVDFDEVRPPLVRTYRITTANDIFYPRGPGQCLRRHIRHPRVRREGSSGPRLGR